MIKLHKHKIVTFTNKYGRTQIMQVSDLEPGYVELRSDLHNHVFFLKLDVDGDKLSDIIKEIK